MTALVLHVRLHDGRYHGAGDWPPSPARLFQALVAGAGLGGYLGGDDQEALRWLEKQGAPIIAAPRSWRPRRGVLFYMPNNDSDRIDGDPLRIAKIRTATKIFRPIFFDAAVPFVYAWTFEGTQRDRVYASVVCSLVERLYQLGRGVDMAWGWGEIVDDSRVDELLATYAGCVYWPAKGKGGVTLQTPCDGSLRSIRDRYRAYGERFRLVKNRDAVRVVFRQPPRAQFRSQAYGKRPRRALYQLWSDSRETAFAPWPLTRASTLVVQLRDAALERLKRALPARAAEIDRVLIGRRPDFTNDGPPEDRVRIVPLPSIGHVHADREIRRVLVEVPPTCPVDAADVHWAFSGLEVTDASTGEIRAVLTPADDDQWLRYYGVEDPTGYRLWRTVTPAALPGIAMHRRIGAARRLNQPKSGDERAREQVRAIAAVRQALRHSGVWASVESIGVRREPFEGKGARVEPFAAGTRFTKDRLWHVEIRFAEPVTGPLVIGDGRFLGLGLMVPALEVHGVHAFAIEAGTSAYVEPADVVQAWRRAIMAQAQAAIGSKEGLPPFFSGHAPDGGPAKSEQYSHLAFAFDPDGGRLLVIAPHVMERRTPTADEQRHLEILNRAVGGIRELRAGRAGLLRLRRTTVEIQADPLFAASKTWESVTPYQVTRHAHGVTAGEALAIDLRTECRRRGLPLPRVVASEWRGVPGAGLEGWVTLHFDVVVDGPLLLGKSRLKGGGLFRHGQRTRGAP